MKVGKIKELSFIIAFTFAVLTTHSNVIPFYGGNGIHIILKLILIVISLGLLSFINRKNEKLMCKYPPIITNVTLALLIFDFTFTGFSGTLMLFKIWWLAAIFVAESTLFLTLTIAKVEYYEYFYYRFWKGFTPTFIFTFIYCFVRKPNSYETTINYIPFKRSLKFLINFLKNPTGTFENPLYFFGNIIFFIPIPFILKSFCPKLKEKYLILIGFIIPIIVESYQYILACGDVDIDDLLLNWMGFGIGLLIEKTIKNKLLQNL